MSAAPAGDPLVDRSATVFVTRPAGDARKLIDALRERGRRVVALPVLGIEPVDDPGALMQALARLADYRLVVFVSPNAIRQALAHRPDPWPADVTIGVMGPGSVEALRAHGIAAPTHRVLSPAPVEATQSTTVRFDSEALFAALDASLGLASGFDGRVLLLRGNGGRAWFADRLRGLGIAVDEVEAYRRVRPDLDAATAASLRALVAAQAAALFVVTSSEGVDHLIALVDEVGIGARDWLLGCTLLVPHGRIRERAEASGFTRVALCAPGDVGVLAAIE